MPGLEQYKQIMTRKEAAEYIGFSAGTLAVWASTKKYAIKSFKVGRSIRYRKEDLDHFINQGLIP